MYTTFEIKGDILYVTYPEKLEGEALDRHIKGAYEIYESGNHPPFVILNMSKLGFVNMKNRRKIVEAMEPLRKSVQKVAMVGVPKNILIRTSIETLNYLFNRKNVKIIDSVEDAKRWFMA